MVLSRLRLQKSGAIDFSEYSRFMEQVQNMTRGRKRRKSCMKVPTQRSSISSCERPNPKKKKHNQHSVTRSRLLSDLQKSFRRKNLNLDESLPKVSPERPSTVRFFDVEVREYGVTVSDNPGVRAGVALEVRSGQILCPYSYY